MVELSRTTAGKEFENVVSNTEKLFKELSNNIFNKPKFNEVKYLEYIEKEFETKAFFVVPLFHIG